MKFLKIALWIALGMLLVAVLVEAVMWLAFSSKRLPEFQVTLQSETPEGWDLQTTQKIRYFDRFLRSSTVQTVSKPEGAVRILVFGGGNTENLLQGDEFTWWGNLQTLLRKEFPDTRIEVGAISNSRLTVLQGAKFCESWAGYLDADIVVANFGLSDVLEHSPEYEYKPGKYGTVSVYPRPSTTSEFFCSFSQVARAYRNSKRGKAWKARLEKLREPNIVFGWLEKARKDYPDTLVGAKVNRNPEKEAGKEYVERDPAKEFIDGVLQFHKNAKAIDAGFLFVTEPTIHETLLPQGEVAGRLRMGLMTTPAKGNTGPRYAPADFGWVASELTRYYELAGEKCAQAGIPIVDLNASLPKNLEIFIDDELMTDKGAQIMAEALLPEVSKLVRSRLEK